MKVIVEADGGSRGNPGPAGFGAVVLGRRPHHRAGRARSVDRRHHQQRRRVPRTDRRAGAGAPARRRRGRGADGLQAGRRADVAAAGRSSIPAWPNCTSRQARIWRRHSTRSSFAWIPREQNKHADRLANEAMDGLRPDSPGGRADASLANSVPPTRRPGGRGAAVDVDRQPRRTDPPAVAAPRADRTVPAAALLRARQPRAHRHSAGARPPTRPGTCRPRAVSRRGGQLAAAARPRHRHGGRRCARAGRAGRRRPDRDRLRRLGGADLLRSRRTGPGPARPLAARHQPAGPRAGRASTTVAQRVAAGAGPDHRRVRPRRPCWWSRM